MIKFPQGELKRMSKHLRVEDDQWEREKGGWKYNEYLVREQTRISKVLTTSTTPDDDSDKTLRETDENNVKQRESNEK